MKDFMEEKTLEAAMDTTVNATLKSANGLFMQGLAALLTASKGTDCFELIEEYTIDFMRNMLGRKY